MNVRLQLNCPAAFLTLIVIFGMAASTSLKAQPNTGISLQKPKKYEDRQLASEKTAEKKNTVFRRFTQSGFTHYNYYFNAEQKLQDILMAAKAQFKEDYTQLLPFYNYTLDATANEQNMLDSLFYKCTAGILLHDLRNAWIDDLYLLLGKAYFYKKDFDSAAFTFQYINYAYAPKDDGYDIPLGSNASNTNGIFTIVTKEQRNLWKQLWTNPPVRNEALIWQIRTLIEQRQIAEASGMIELLEADPLFPKRLLPELHEVEAYLFYTQNIYDSAAYHLQQCISLAGDKAAQSRRQYLIAQLWEKSGNAGNAVSYYEKSASSTNNPVMEVYARLNLAALQAKTGNNKTSAHIQSLLQMSRREKYQAYQDIILYAAAQLAYQQGDFAMSEQLLSKATRVIDADPEQRSKNFLLLGNIAYQQEKFGLAAAAYDSLNVSLLPPSDQALMNNRKPALANINKLQNSILLQDSLLKIAALPLDERNALLKKVLRQLRKEQGLKESAEDSPADNFNTISSDNSNLFSSNNAADFYFANNSVKARGFSEFKSRWGERPDVDNWRRIAAVERTMQSFQAAPQQTNDALADNQLAGNNAEISLERLLNQIPQTEAQKNNADSLIAAALLATANTLLHDLENYTAAAKNYQRLLQRYPNKRSLDILKDFYLSCQYAGMQQRADSVLGLMRIYYPANATVQQMLSGTRQQTKDAGTTAYEAIYQDFIAGNFQQALARKKQADTQFGEQFWTPQLLYIESLYHIQQGNDSLAIQQLKNIENRFANSPLKEKAATMRDVLSRRKEIEAYLTNLDVTREEEMVTRRVDLNDTKAVTVLPAKRADSTSRQKTITTVPQPQPAITLKLPETIKNDYQFNPADTQYVGILLNKVDDIFITETRNAFNRYHQTTSQFTRLRLQTNRLDEQRVLLITGPFLNAGEALDYLDKTKPAARSRIVPWLQADKYSFGFFSNNNLTLLLERKDWEVYQAFLKNIFPDKF
jgi:hypothetical protein